MKFFVNDDCIGCGLCPSVCGEVFSMNGDGVAVAVAGEVDGQMQQCALEAQAQCPVSAIEHS